MIVTSPRSGSSLLMRVFAESPDCAVTSRLILMGNYGMDPLFSPDYTILDKPERLGVFQAAVAENKIFLVTKEELRSHREKGECSQKVLSESEAYQQVKPLFLVRDPIQKFDSWGNVGWCDVNSLVECYKNIYDMVDEARRNSAQCVLYERLLYMPHETI